MQAWDCIRPGAYVTQVTQAGAATPPSDPDQCSCERMNMRMCANPSPSYKNLIVNREIYCAATGAARRLGGSVLTQVKTGSRNGRILALFHVMHFCHTATYCRTRFL
jgi:hypothetical protein